MRGSILSAIALLALPITLTAAVPIAEMPADLRSAAHAFDEAQMHNDGAALSRLLADDYLLVNSAGALETKADFIHDYTAPGFTLEPFTIEQPVEKIWADGAVLGGIATLKGMSDGKPYEARLRFADIWAKRSGRWQVIYTQASRAPKP
jgi:ketosteroid isomerase-like protein